MPGSFIVSPFSFIRSEGLLKLLEVSSIGFVERVCNFPEAGFLFVVNPVAFQYSPNLADPFFTIRGESGFIVFHSEREFGILHFLAKRPGWVFTRNQIIDNVRGDDYPVTDRSVDVQIVSLRKKLGPFSDLIETVRGVGYRFRE